MDYYNGLMNDFNSGGKHVKATGWGGEVFNFRQIGSKCYSYFRLKLIEYNNPSTIKIEKLGATKSLALKSKLLFLLLLTNYFPSRNIYTYKGILENQLHRSLSVSAQYRKPWLSNIGYMPS